LATRKFKEIVDGKNENKFALGGAIVTDLLAQKNEDQEYFEVELPADKTKFIPGITIKENQELPVSELSRKNQFKKLNYS